MHEAKNQQKQNKALHWMPIPLRSIVTSELSRWANEMNCSDMWALIRRGARGEKR